jgi:hypothetical protein
MNLRKLKLKKPHHKLENWRIRSTSAGRVIEGYENGMWFQDFLRHVDFKTKIAEGINIDFELGQVDPYSEEKFATAL